LCTVSGTKFAHWRHILRQFLLPVLASALLVSSCEPSNIEGVANAEVRLPAAPGRPGVGYFLVNGGAKDSQLMSVTSPKIVRIELHETMQMGAVMQMKPLDGGVTIPAGTTVKFSPGGRHAMLFDINPAVKPGMKLPLTFAYADGHKVEIEALVKAPGDATEHKH
jgi:periplasmic copper chaperone A